MMARETAEVFEILRARAIAGGPAITYGEIEQQTGLNAHLVVPRYLGQIWRWCEANNLPHLNAIVVNAEDRLPGAGYQPQGHPVTWEEQMRTLATIYAFDWASVSFPDTGR